MRRYLHTLTYLLGIHLLGLLFLSAFRLVQFVALHGMLQPDGEASRLTAFVKGVWFDNVIACYLMVVPLVVLLLTASFGYCHRHLRHGAAIWFCVLYGVVLAISTANIPYFAYFFKNLDASIFGWFGYVGTTTGMLVGEKSYWLYILLFILSIITFVWIVRKLWKRADKRIGGTFVRHDWKTTATCLCITVVAAGLCIFGIRGRTGYNPIKISQAYYCNDPFLNQLGINPAFNLFTSTLDGMRKENAELHLMPYDKAVSYTREALHITGQADSTAILRRHVSAEGETMRPNIVIILMESMSANLMQTFGQQEHLTPTLDSLYQHSLAFTHFYSAGIHTNHGLTATLYSFPAMMMRNLMKGTVTPHRSGLPTVLKEQGYHNLFFMTHESQYDNMNAFFRTNGYDEVFAQEDYPKKEVVNSFGVPDKYLFDYALATINRTATAQQPFMATILTISNHPPYIIPDGFKSTTNDPETQIVEYADRCIGDFLTQARLQSWYDNTIFVILADHGKLVGQMDSELPQSYNHIPCIIFGKDVENSVYDGLGTQIDLMPTLLGIMNMSYDYDGFGVDLLRERRNRVFYTSDTHVVARDSAGVYLYSPQMEKDFCYYLTTDGNLHPTTFNNQFSHSSHCS